MELAAINRIRERISSDEKLKASLVLCRDISDGLDDIKKTQLRNSGANPLIPILESPRIFYDLLDKLLELEPSGFEQPIAEGPNAMEFTNKAEQTAFNAAKTIPNSP